MATSPSTISSDARGKRILQNVDRISTLPDDLLLMILMKMPTENAIQTSVLSTRWKSVWKHIPSLIFDMRNTTNATMGFLADRSGYIVDLITKVIDNHNGHLEYCRIDHFSYQSIEESCVLQTWVETLIHLKGTKSLALLNHHGQSWRPSVLNLMPYTFCPPALTSLLFYQYDFKNAYGFNRCPNLMILQLDRIRAEVGVMNTIIAGCPSLKVLVLEVSWYNQNGCLKIHSESLKFLYVGCSYIERIEVSASLLDIFSIRYTKVTRDNFLLTAPRLLQFNRNYWPAEIPHISYNISCNAQEEESIEHKFLVSRDPDYLVRIRSLAVMVDLRNPREVKMLREVLVSWHGIMTELEIVFKHNNITREEGESSNGGAQKKKWEGAKKILNANFRVEDLLLYNFNGSNKKQFELVSRFITQGIVMNRLMIKTSFPRRKRLKIQAAVVKLKKLPKGNEELRIECFF